MKIRIVATACAVLVSLGAPAGHASEAPKLEAQEWSFTGPFGTFDRPAVHRGLQVYREVCASCHSLALIAFRNLASLGYSSEEIRAIASEYEVEDGPNDEGEMYTRPARPSDHFPPPYPNEQAARAANGGAYPPDLSLITKARKGGADYVYALLTGYREEPPEGVEVMEGMYYNKAFPGHQIAMPPPLGGEDVEFADGTAPTLEQEAHDVVTFLAWAAQPELEQRKRMGVKVMLFLVVFTGMLYAVKKKIWSGVH